MSATLAALFNGWHATAQRRLLIGQLLERALLRRADTCGRRWFVAWALLTSQALEAVEASLQRRRQRLLRAAFGAWRRRDEVVDDSQARRLVTLLRCWSCAASVGAALRRCALASIGERLQRRLLYCAFSAWSALCEDGLRVKALVVGATAAATSGADVARHARTLERAAVLTLRACRRGLLAAALGGWADAVRQAHTLERAASLAERGHRRRLLAAVLDSWAAAAWRRRAFDTAVALARSRRCARLVRCAFAGWTWRADLGRAERVEAAAGVAAVASATEAASAVARLALGDEALRRCVCALRRACAARALAAWRAAAAAARASREVESTSARGDALAAAVAALEQARDDAQARAAGRLAVTRLRRAMAAALVAWRDCAARRASLRRIELRARAVAGRLRGRAALSRWAQATRQGCDARAAAADAVAAAEAEGREALLRAQAEAALAEAESAKAEAQAARLAAAAAAEAAAGALSLAEAAEVAGAQQSIVAAASSADADALRASVASLLRLRRLGAAWAAWRGAGAGCGRGQALARLLRAHALRQARRCARAVFLAWRARATLAAAVAALVQRWRRSREAARRRAVLQAWAAAARAAAATHAALWLAARTAAAGTLWRAFVVWRDYGDVNAATAAPAPACNGHAPGDAAVAATRARRREARTRRAVLRAWAAQASSTRRLCEATRLALVARLSRRRAAVLRAWRATTAASRAAADAGRAAWVRRLLCDVVAAWRLRAAPLAARRCAVAALVARCAARAVLRAWQEVASSPRAAVKGGGSPLAATAFQAWRFVATCEA